jgi:aryl-alcohol dehydrogenase (NADP+)
MFAWQFAKAQHVAERNSWTPFVTMQNHYNLLYREEEREMLPLCVDLGVGVIPWSPLARGRLTRDWDETTTRTESDVFARSLYHDEDRAIVDAVASVAERRGVKRAEVALAWVSRQPGVVAPIVGVTRAEHLDDAIASLDVDLTDDDLTELEKPYTPRPVAGIEVRR